MFEVEERATGAERVLKLWRKAGGDADADLRELWRHEMRQVTRVMAYSGARDVIVEVLEIVEDDENFGVLLDRIEQPLFEKRRRVGRDHWLRTLATPRSRALHPRWGSSTHKIMDVADYSGGPAYRFEADEDLVEQGPWFLRGQKDVGSEQVIARRLRILKALDTRVDLAQMLLDPWRVRRSSRETLSKEDRADKAFTDLDEPKQEALLAIWETVPSFFVVGPPGVGKTRLATEVATRRFKEERATRMLVTAQGHDALDHLKSKIQEALAQARIDGLMVVRSTTPERRKSTPDETSPVAVDLLQRLSNSKAMDMVPPAFSERVRTLTKEIRTHVAAGTPPLAEPRSAFGAMMRLILDAADVVVSTVNSSDIERMVEGRDQFDWVIVEEAARATGPELVGALMLSARRLLIGDHRQLPAFDADRMVKILNDHSLVEETLRQAGRLLAPLLRDGELDEVEAMLKADAETLSSMRRDARNLLDPFREVVVEDERLRKAKAGHRPISATLTEQRRMDPAIARIVSGAFYGDDLTTSTKRANDALTEESPILYRGPLPSSPVVVVDFDHVSSPVRGTVPASEHGHPPWHNPSETDAVLDVLRHIRARPGAAPTLAILTPYRAQVDKIRTRMLSERNSTLGHLSAFSSVRSDGQFVGTVDSFQGNEADLVVLSLVRNNGRSGRGALGFLQDPRRMNVALSRAKSQLIIVGSLEFLKETVRGVNPEREDHDLDFLTKLTGIIEGLAGEARNDLPLAAIVKPAALRGSP